MPSSVWMTRSPSPPTSKSESTPRRRAPCTGLTPSAVRRAAVRTDTPVATTRPIRARAPSTRRGAPDSEEALQRLADGGAEVAAGVDELLHRCAPLGATTGEVQQAGDGRDPEHRTDDDPGGAVGRLRFLLGSTARPTQQRDARGDEPDRDEDAQDPEEGAGRIVETAAEGSGEVGVDAEAGEQSEGDERDAPDVVAVAGERAPHRARLGRPGRLSGPALRRRGPPTRGGAATGRTLLGGHVVAFRPGPHSARRDQEYRGPVRRRWTLCRRRGDRCWSGRQRVSPPRRRP